MTIKKLHLFSQYDEHERNYKPVNDLCFSQLILSKAMVLLIIS